MEEELVLEYLVRTQEQWDWLMEYLEETTDLKWGVSFKPTEKEYWDIYKENTKVYARGHLLYGEYAYWDSSEAFTVEVGDLMDEVEMEFRERKQPNKTSSQSITSELEEAITHSEMMELLDLDDTFVYVYCYGEEEGVLEVYGFKAEGFGMFEAFDAYYIEDEDGILVAIFSVEQVARIWKQVGKVEEEYGEE